MGKWKDHRIADKLHIVLVSKRISGTARVTDRGVLHHGSQSMLVMVLPKLPSTKETVLEVLLETNEGARNCGELPLIF